jgi:CHASE2 domain-containing sensor protein
MNLLDSKILKDSSAYHLLQDMMPPEMEDQIRAEIEDQTRVEMQEKIRVEEARSILVDLATDRFGAPNEAQKALLDGIEDHDRLVRLCKKVGSLSTWEEFLDSESAP